MLKNILKNKMMIVALSIFLLIILVVVILTLSGQLQDDSGYEHPDASISDGLEIVQEESDDEQTSEDSVTAPSIWSEPEKEASGEDGSKKQPTTDNKENEKQEQQEADGIPDDETYEDKEPFGRIF